MTAVHDTLRQAIADEIDAWGTRGNEYRPLADAVLAVVMADPVVERAFAITHAVDNEPKYARPLSDPKSFDAGHDMLLAKFRAAGKTT